MGNTPSNIVANARLTNAQVLNVERARKKEVDTVVFTVRVKAHTEKVYYDVVIEFYPTEMNRDVFKKPSIDNPVWVKCSCPYFLFNCEYALAKHGSSEIDYSNGKPPVVTNPRMIPMLCKHLFKGADEAVKRANQLARKDDTYKFV